MKSQIIAWLLAGVLFLTSVSSLALCGWYVVSAKTGVATQNEVTQLNITGSAVRSLLIDSVEYSKRNAAITPLLQSLNVLPRAQASANPATTVPTTPKASSR